MLWRLLWLCICVLPLAALPPVKGTEILWDRFGVPHIFARDHESLFYALGWAQMQSHGDLLLRLYGESRGRAAEYWGEQHLENDLYLHTVGAPERALQWQQQQSPEFRRNLDAFAAGINAYARAFPQRLDQGVQRVLPVTGLDPLLHAQRVIYFQYIAPPRKSGFLLPEQQGSNAWAVAPSRTANGHALLLANPHQTWSGAMLFWEAHLNAPGINLYGAMQVGFPVMRYAFSDTLGFSQTVNTIDVSDTYRLTLKNGGYLFDGAVLPFETRDVSISIRRADGTLRTQTFKIRRSVHGPIVSLQKDTAVALRVAGLDRPGLLEQYWAMGRARNLTEFQTALARHQVPMFTVMYADISGHIMHLYNGILPQRPKGDYQYWQATISGDTSATLWTKTHSLSEMPRALDPPSGWLQNTNDPPWSTTYPLALDPERFPSYMAPRTLSLRTARSVRLLSEAPKLTLEELIRRKHSTRSEMADRILDDLSSAVRRNGSETARRAMQVLERWDRQFEFDSRGAVLFDHFGSHLAATPNAYAVPPDIRAPLTTPRGLRDPAAAVSLLDRAARDLEGVLGRLDLPWGDLYRFQRGSADLPANGASGILGLFRVFTYTTGHSRRAAAAFGDSYVAAIEFAQPVRAKVLLSYGNSSQPGSRHIDDQLPFLARKELRTAWRTRAEIEANLEERKVF